MAEDLLRSVTAQVAGRIEGDLAKQVGLQKSLPLTVFHARLACLLGQDPVDFALRSAALTALYESGKARFTSEERDAALYWLSDADRTTVWRNLVDGGFVRHSEKGWSVTPEGNEIYSLLQLFHTIGSRPDLVFSAAINDVVEELGGDPALTLQNLTMQLRQVEAALQDARISQSTPLMQAQLLRSSQALSIGNRVIDRARRLTDPALQTHLRDMHSALASMYLAAAQVREMHARMTSAFIQLPSGVTPHDVTVTLMARDLEDLAAALRPGLALTVQPHLVVREDMVAERAEAFLAKERLPPPEVPGPSSNAKPAKPDVPKLSPAIKALAADLANLEGPVELIDFLGKGTEADVLLRLCALDLLGKKPPHPIYREIAEQPWKVDLLDGFSKRGKGPIRFMTNARLIRRDD